MKSSNEGKTVFVSKEIADIYALEDENKIIPLFGWETYKLRRDDICCDHMFNYLKKTGSWIVFIPYDKTYAIPYVSLSNKRQLIQLRKSREYTGEMQMLHFCPFCGTSLLNDELKEKRHQLMADFFENNKKIDEDWWDFWERNRHKKKGKLFFSAKWRSFNDLL